MSSLSGQKEVEYLQPPMMDQTEKKRDKMEGEAERQSMLPAPVCLGVSEDPCLHRATVAL